MRNFIVKRPGKNNIHIKADKFRIDVNGVLTFLTDDGTPEGINIASFTNWSEVIKEGIGR